MQNLNQKINEFLILKVHQTSIDANEKQSINFFYLSENKAFLESPSLNMETNVSLEKFEKSNLSQDFTKEPSSPQKGEVNEIIVKIEMKKF